MIRPWTLIAVGLVAVSGIIGCGESHKPAPAADAPTGTTSGATPPAGSQATTANSGPPRPTSTGVTKIPRGKLAIGDYMPPLDDDRVEIAKPKGWQAMQRDSDYLTRFYETSRSGLPRIEITVEARTYGDLVTVTPENVDQFAKLVAADLGDLELVEKVIPLQIGGTPCARYVGRVQLNVSAGAKLDAERQRLLVLQDGRLYTIDLLVLPNTLLRSRDAAYAVCASLRFGGQGVSPEATGDLLPATIDPLPATGDLLPE